jgi:nitroreductase
MGPVGGRATPALSLPGRRMGFEMATSEHVLSATALEAVAEAARLAPSIHNSQPWTFRRLPDGLGIVEDQSRALPVVDPVGRERLISCGAAVLSARVALRARGLSTAVALLPEPGEPGLLAVVRATGTQPVGAEDVALAEAIPVRRTHRRVYRSHLVAEGDLLELRRAVGAEGARLNLADPSARRKLAHLLRRAVRQQAADPELRGEVERWVRRGSGQTAVDGIPRESLGTSPYPVDSLVHAGHQGAPEATGVEEEMARSTVLVVSTRGDTRLDWLVAGMALQRLLLVATTKGLVATFADQAIQAVDLRGEVAEAMGIWGEPQVMLRIGRAVVEAPPTPRRSLADLWE